MQIKIQIKSIEGLEPVDEIISVTPMTIITIRHSDSYFFISRSGQAGLSYDINDGDEIKITFNNTQFS